MLLDSLVQETGAIKNTGSRVSGCISSSEDLIVNIEFDNISDVESLALVLMSGNKTLSRPVELAPGVRLRLSDQERQWAEDNQSSVYLLSATLKDKTTRTLLKGPVNWQTGTEKSLTR